MRAFNRWVLGVLAVLAFLAPLKFGTPVVIQSLMPPPQGAFQWIYFTWPNELLLLGVVTSLLWFLLDSRRSAARPDTLLILPLVFLATQAAAYPLSINRQVSMDTVLHFSVCVLVFYAAAWYVRDGAALMSVWAGLGLATFVVCVLALQQYFGGLAETRRFVAMYTDTSRMPPDLLLKLTSNRVFGSLVYPNALAGFLVVVFGPVLAWIWVRARAWDRRVKWIALVCAGAVMVECLVLTGSRGGYVAFAVSVLAGLWCLIRGRSRRATWVLLAVLILLGGVFWVAQQAGVAHVGLRSLEARLDYAEGAVAVIRDHFWLGTGPGTFGSIYPTYKTAGTEEAQLVHNNYLQVWSDSGVAAFLAFAALWIVALVDVFRLSYRRQSDAAAVALCSALTGWVVHGLVDFDLYVPGVALPAFLLLGSLQGLKEPPTLEPAIPEEREVPQLRRLTIGLVCALMVVGVAWREGRHLLAGIAHGRAQSWWQSNPVAAQTQAQRAIDLAPGNPYYHSSAGDLAFELGEYEKAIAAYQNAIQNDPYRAPYHWRLARAVIADRGVDRWALEELRWAVRLNPTNQRYRDELKSAEERIRQGE